MEFTGNFLDRGVKTGVPKPQFQQVLAELRTKGLKVASCRRCKKVPAVDKSFHALWHFADVPESHDVRALVLSELQTGDGGHRDCLDPATRQLIESELEGGVVPTYPTVWFACVVLGLKAGFVHDGLEVTFTSGCDLELSDMHTQQAAFLHASGIESHFMSLYSVQGGPHYMSQRDSEYELEMIRETTAKIDIAHAEQQQQLAAMKRSAEASKQGNESDADSTEDEIELVPEQDRDLVELSAQHIKQLEQVREELRVTKDEAAVAKSRHILELDRLRDTVRTHKTRADQVEQENSELREYVVALEQGLNAMMTARVKRPQTLPQSSFGTPTTTPVKPASEPNPIAETASETTPITKSTSETTPSTKSISKTTRSKASADKSTPKPKPKRSLRLQGAPAAIVTVSTASGVKGGTQVTETVPNFLPQPGGDTEAESTLEQTGEGSHTTFDLTEGETVQEPVSDAETEPVETDDTANDPDFICETPPPKPPTKSKQGRSGSSGKGKGAAPKQPEQTPKEKPAKRTGKEIATLVNNLEVIKIKNPNEIIICKLRNDDKTPCQLQFPAHEMASHNKDHGRMFTCNICFFGFKTGSAWINHHNKTHKKKEHPCSFPGCIFKPKSIQYLNDHMWIHTYHYACQKCGRPTGNKSAKAKHEAVCKVIPAADHDPEKAKLAHHAAHPTQARLNDTPIRCGNPNCQQAFLTLEYQAHLAACNAQLADQIGEGSAVISSGGPSAAAGKPETVTTDTEQTTTTTVTMTTAPSTTGTVTVTAPVSKTGKPTTELSGELTEATTSQEVFAKGAASCPSSPLPGEGQSGESGTELSALPETSAETGPLPSFVDLAREVGFPSAFVPFSPLNTPTPPSRSESRAATPTGRSSSRAKRKVSYDSEADDPEPKSKSRKVESTETELDDPRVGTAEQKDTVVQGAVPADVQEPMETTPDEEETVEPPQVNRPVTVLAGATGPPPVILEHISREDAIAMGHPDLGPDSSSIVLAHRKDGTKIANVVQQGIMLQNEFRKSPSGVESMITSTKDLTRADSPVIVRSISMSIPLSTLAQGGSTAPSNQSAPQTTGSTPGHPAPGQETVSTAASKQFQTVVQQTGEDTESDRIESETGPILPASPNTDSDRIETETVKTVPAQVSTEIPDTNSETVSTFSATQDSGHASTAAQPEQPVIQISNTSGEPERVILTVVTDGSDEQSHLKNLPHLAVTRTIPGFPDASTVVNTPRSPAEAWVTPPVAQGSEQVLVEVGRKETAPADSAELEGTAPAGSAEETVKQTNTVSAPTNTVTSTTTVMTPTVSVSNVPAPAAETKSETVSETVTPEDSPASSVNPSPVASHTRQRCRKQPTDF